MCAGSEVVGHVPTRRGMVDGSSGGGGGGGGGGSDVFGAPLKQDMAAAGVMARSFPASELDIEIEAGLSGGGGEGAAAAGQLGVFHGVKQRPSKQEAEYYREQIYIAEFELGDDEGFED
jgi:hypothetical protein